MYSKTTGEIAEMVGGCCCGRPDVEITGVASLKQACEQDISFVRTEEALSEASVIRAGAVIASQTIEGYQGAAIVCEDPEDAFRCVLLDYEKAVLPRPTGVSDLATIAPSASIGKGAAVGSFAVIEGGAVIGEETVVYPLVYVGYRARIGKRTVIYPHVTVRDGVQIGDDCIIHPNAVIGNDGFGYIQRDGRYLRLPQMGGVEIGNGVEIGALTTVNRAMLDQTVVEDDVKIDDHSHLAHNVRVGERSLLVAYAKLAGSVRIGKGVLVAEDVGISDHVAVGDGAILAGGSGIHNNVPPGAVMWGYPARSMGEQRRIFALLGKLPDMHKKIRTLEKEVEALRSLMTQRPSDHEARD